MKKRAHTHTHSPIEREKRKNTQNKESWFVLTRIRFWLKANSFTDALWEWMRWSELFAFWPSSHFLSTLDDVDGHWFDSVHCVSLLVGFSFFSFLPFIFFLLFFLLSSFCMYARSLYFGAKASLECMCVCWCLNPLKINAFYSDKSHTPDVKRYQTCIPKINVMYRVDFFLTNGKTFSCRKVPL